jgi:Tol biopolymer transport system component
MERWERVKHLVDEALALDGAQRTRYLDEVCAEEPTLRAEVESLLGYENDTLLGSGASADHLVGATLGRYRVLEEIGRGGMGRVYRALDSELGRHVAIKMLPEEFVSQPERVRRFEREARLVASLNHPRIAAIHGYERQGGAPFLVMELVAGETLEQRLRRGPLPLHEALALAAQIAEALEAAHEKGVVHRDLKPSNVKLTEDGAVKVLDFGLAKALGEGTSGDEPASGPTETLNFPTTREGLVLGTPPYMSPEQVGGARMDHRTDVWSFGVVVWEMLAGTRPFRGDSTAEVLGAVLRDDPDWKALRSGTPPAVVGLLRRCLTRDRRRRLQSIAEARILIEDCLAAPRHGAVSGGSQPRSPRASLLASALLIAAIVALGVGFGWWRDPGVPPRRVHSSLEAPPGVRLQAGLGFVLSSDGRRLAFVGRGRDGVARLWVRSLADPEARPLAGTEGAFKPFWSADGRDIGYFDADAGTLERVPAAGGPARVVTANLELGRGGAWSPDGRIVFAPDSRSGLYEVEASGGDPRPLTVLGEGETSHRWPQFLPDGETLLFLVQTAEPGAPDDRSRVEALLPSGERREVLRVNSSAAYSAPQSLLFWRDGALQARSFDPETLRVRGEARRLAEPVGFDFNEWAAFSAAADTLVYYGALTRPGRFEWRGRSGQHWALDVPEGRYADVACAPDGRRVAYVEDNTTVWILDSVRGTRNRLTREPVDHYGPSWSRDGEWLVYAADAAQGKGGRIIRQPASGIGERQVLYTSEILIYRTAWSPDGRRIAFEEAGDVRVLDLETGQVEAAVATPSWDGEPQFSPDGRWLAYASEESGRSEVYVAAVGGGPEKWLVSAKGGFAPRWSPAGDEILYHGLDDGIWVAAVDLGGTPELGVPTTLFAATGARWLSFDVAPDGRLIALVDADGDGSGSFRLVQNWSLLPDPMEP